MNVSQRGSRTRNALPSHPPTHYMPTFYKQLVLSYKQLLLKNNAHGLEPPALSALELLPQADQLGHQLQLLRLHRLRPEHAVGRFQAALLHHRGLWRESKARAQERVRQKLRELFNSGSGREQQQQLQQQPAGPAGPPPAAAEPQPSTSGRLVHVDDAVYGHDGMLRVSGWHAQCCARAAGAPRCAPPCSLCGLHAALLERRSCAPPAPPTMPPHPVPRSACCSRPSRQPAARSCGTGTPRS